MIKKLCPPMLLLEQEKTHVNFYFSRFKIVGRRNESHYAQVDGVIDKCDFL